MTPVLLSENGSDRATAYNFSNKILRHAQGLLVSWLEAPHRSKGTTRIQLGVCDPVTGHLEQAMTLGEGIDNHCGLSMLSAPDGCVHTFLGAHHGGFLHRWSHDPADPEAWSAPESVGSRHSYPAVVLDGDGTFHLIYRASYRGEGETWQLEYIRRETDGVWSAPTVLARCPVPGYSHFMHSLSIGPSGALHLTLQFHYAASGSAKQGKTKLAAHMRSDDDGATWTSEGQTCHLPLTIDNASAFVSYVHDEAASIRIGTHVVDADDEPWLFCSMPEAPFGVVFRRNGAAWQTISLDAVCPDLDFVEGRSTAISRDPSGTIHLLISTAARGRGQGWYHPANELHHFAFPPDAATVWHQQLTTDDPAQARWLPSIEHWNWQSPDQSCIDGHWFTYTSGLNAGWMDAAGYDDTLKTQVWLDRLAP